MKNTKIIHLNYNISNEMMDRECLWIYKGLQKSSSVHTLIINFNGSLKMIGQWMKRLTETIKRLKHLKKFHFNFQQCQVSDQGLEYLKTSFRNLALLVDVRVEFSGYFLYEEFLNKLE